MSAELTNIQKTLQEILKSQIPPLRIETDTDDNFVVAGTKAVMQGKKKVDGIYFASVVPKAKDIRLYFSPIYTHRDAIGELSDPLKKFLKGKSCFHVKKLDEELEKEIRAMVQRGVDAYLKDELI